MGLRTRLAHLPLRVQVRMALSGITMLALLLAAGALLVIETLRTEDDLPAHARYIVANPVRARIVRHVSEYPFWDAIWL